MASTEFADYFPPYGQFGGPNEPWPLAAGVDPLNLGGHRGKDLLLVLEPADPASALELGPFGPYGDPEWPEGGEWGWAGTRVELYPASTTSRSSGNADTPAATFVDGILPAAPNFGSSLFAGVDPLGRSRPTVGELVLVDPDGKLDYLLDYVWDGAPVTLKRGERGADFATFETVARFTARALIADLDTKRIDLRDPGWQLDALLHNEFYKGEGGLEGDASLKGRWKPWALGWFFNEEPVLLSTADQIFQWSLGSSQQLIAFKHGGVPLAIGADYPTYEALAAATIPGGECATCLAKSLVRPNVTLQYGVRVEGVGDGDTAYGHPAPTKRGEIARRIATTRGQSRLDDAAQIDVTSFNRMDTRHSAPVGWFFSQEITKAEALDIVLSGILGWWRLRPDGRLAVGWLESPSIGSSLAFEFKAEGMGKPRLVAMAPPRAASFVGWSINGSPQGRSELAPSVDDETASILAQEARWAQAASPAVAALYPTAKQVFVPQAGFRYEVDAAAEAARQQGILEVERRRWQVDFEIDPFVDLIGRGATINNVGRMGFGAAKPVLFVSLDIQGTSAVTVEFYG
jgi:hypothetical protein